MDVYSYNGNNVEPGDLTGWLPKKNCRIKINFPASMSDTVAASIMELIKSKEVADILLYGAVSFISSEEDSKLFPSTDYIILVVPSNVATKITNIDNSAFVVHADGDRVIYMLSGDSILQDVSSGILLIKDNDTISARVDSITSVVDDNSNGEDSDWIIGL
jgi:hypothetical protein